MCTLFLVCNVYVIPGEITVCKVTQCEISAHYSDSLNTVLTDKSSAVASFLGYFCHCSFVRWQPRSTRRIEVNPEQVMCHHAY